MPRPDITKIATEESRRKGALAANEKRRQQGLSLRARVAEELEKQAGELVAAALGKAKDGDWQAFLALWKQTHGQPAVEVTGEDGGAIHVELSDAAERFESRVARIAERGGEEETSS